MPTKPSAPKGQAALAKRRKERADLKGQDIIWIGIAATELNIQRIGTLLMLADMPMVLERQAEEDQLAAVLPIETLEVAEPEFNCDHIRRDITLMVVEILKVSETHKVRIIELCKQHGGERLTLVPDNQLPELYNAVKRLREEIV